MYGLVQNMLWLNLTAYYSLNGSGWLEFHGNPTWLEIAASLEFLGI